MKEHSIQIDRGKCIGCGLCRQDCPENNIALRDKKAAIKEQTCIKCGHCVAICPKAAVSMTGFDEPPAEIESRSKLDGRELLEAIKRRRSIRQFRAQAVADEIIAEIIEAGRFTRQQKMRRMYPTLF